MYESKRREPQRISCVRSVSAGILERLRIPLVKGFTCDSAQGITFLIAFTFKFPKHYS